MASRYYPGIAPPWRPGYAIPESVLEEGLERHAYVTKMAPRGTYDRSTDGTAGYAVPQYVLEERTGRGTYTTKWLPRGYYGPAIPHYLNRHPNPNIVQGPPALSGFWDKVKDVGKIVGRAAALPVTFGVSEVYINRKAIGGALKPVGKLVCKVATSLPAGGGAAAGSTPQGAAIGIGLGITQGLCAPGYVPVPQTPTESFLSQYGVPLAIGGAALVAVVLLTKKKAAP